MAPVELLRLLPGERLATWYVGQLLYGIELHRGIDQLSARIEDRVVVPQEAPLLELELPQEFRLFSIDKNLPLPTPARKFDPKTQRPLVLARLVVPKLRP
jgi:hypothetical protein